MRLTLGQSLFQKSEEFFFLFFFFFSLLLLLLFCGKDGGIDFAIIVFDDECDEEEAV